MARLVLIHGAFVGAWKWERLATVLEAAGHSVEAPDLPGSGADQTPVEAVTLDAYVERVKAQLDERDEPAVLVGHSMGGVVATQVAARYPERVEAIVYMAAFAPADGQSLVDLTGLPEAQGDEIQANMVVEGAPPVARMSPEAARSASYSGCSDEDIAWAVPRHRPQPLAPFTQAVAIPDGAFDAISRSYVVCTGDRAIPAALQRRMATDSGIDEVVELDSDHSPQLSRTAELAEAIDRLASLEPSAAG